jgi:hypothetical protein
MAGKTWAFSTKYTNKEAPQGTQKAPAGLASPETNSRSQNQPAVKTKPQRTWEVSQDTRQKHKKASNHTWRSKHEQKGHATSMERHVPIRYRRPGTLFKKSHGKAMGWRANDQLPFPKLLLLLLQRVRNKSTKDLDMTPGLRRRGWVECKFFSRF